MKDTWYLGLLVFALAFLGISLDKSTNANQEIVLKFTQQEVTDGAAQDVMRFVKSQLKELEAGNIQIKQSDNGTLKIAYYSDKDASEIKELLSNQIELVLEDSVPAPGTQFPIPDNGDLTGFELDVFEIQTTKYLAGATGIIVDFKTESVRFFTPDVYRFSEQLKKEETARVTRAYHSYTIIALAIDDSFCTVPQVRAGPIQA